jgi:DNA-binding NtrC family response regulator
VSKEIKVLYVDDEEQLLLLVKNQLTVEGFTVETVNSGEDAFEILAKKTFDVILLDIRMPRISGIDVLKHIQQNKIKSRVVMLTAVDDLSVALEAVKSGAIDYLTKPYEFETLVSAILRAAAK